MLKLAQIEALLVSLLMMFPGAIAQEIEAGTQTANGEEELEGSPGVTPDSFLHGLDVALDNIALALTFDSGAKAKKGLEIARERLLEVKAMAEQKKAEHAERAQKLHDEFVERAEKDFEGLKVEKPEEIDDALEIENEFEKHKERMEKVTNNLRIKIEIRGELNEGQKELIKELLEKMEDKAGEVSIKIDNRREVVKTELKERGLSEEEIDKEFEKSSEKHGLGEAREEAAAARIEHAKTAIENVEMAYRGFLVAREIKENVELVDEDKEFMEMISKRVSEFEANGGKIDFSKVNEEELKSKIEEAKDKLAKAEEAFAEERFGEAFGQATSSMHLSMNAMRHISNAFRGFEFSGGEELEIRVDMKCSGKVEGGVSGEENMAIREEMKEKIRPFIEGEETKERLEKEMREREELQKREALQKLEAEKLAGRVISFEEGNVSISETTVTHEKTTESEGQAGIEEKFSYETREREMREKFESEMKERLEKEFSEREHQFREEAEKRMSEIRERQELRARQHFKAECVAFIKVRAGGGVVEFQLPTDDPEAIITEISARTGISREKIAAALHYNGRMPRMEADVEIEGQ